MDKKGYIKTVEAVISIVAILVFIFTIVPQRGLDEPKVPSVVKNSQEFIRDKVSTNESLRTCIITDPFCKNSDLMTQTIEANLPVGYDYIFDICDSTDCIASTPFDKDVYLTDVFVVSTLEEHNPRIVRIWMWRKG